MGKYDFDFELYDDNTLAWIAQTIEEGSVVLEFGAANGRLTKYLCETKKCTVDIVEIDEQSGKDAAVYADCAMLGEEEGDIEKYLWLNLEKRYDYIVFADVLEHLREPSETLKRCKNVIKKTGKILVSVPNISHNSILIDLWNDKFNYTDTGLLDNTHLKLFTRQSFVNMAEQAGWAVIGERPKYIRVGENEIQNSYRDLPKEVFKAMVARTAGNVYQYMFTLALSSEYVEGKFERIVCMDSSSYYYAEAYFDYNGEMDYKHSVSRNINPAYGHINISLSTLKRDNNIQVKLINCNAVLKNICIQLRTNGKTREVLTFEHNGKEISGMLFFGKDVPKIEFDVVKEDDEIIISAEIVKYDFEDAVLENLVNFLECRELDFQKELSDKIIAYEDMIMQKEQERQNERMAMQEEIIGIKKESLVMQKELVTLCEKQLLDILPKRQHKLIPELISRMNLKLEERCDYGN